MAAATLLGCGSDAAAPPDPAPTLRLPVRVHLLDSRLPPFAATLDETQVGAMIERANEIWTPAGIVWELESVVREGIENEEEIEQILAGPFLISLNQLMQMLPRERLTADDWDVFLAHDLTEAGAPPGTYLWPVPAVLSSEVDPSGRGDPGRILAHELGHSLTLVHVPCTSAGNLMAPACDGADPTSLTPAQIEQARRQAKTGEPTETF